MPNLIERLRESAESGTLDPALLLESADRIEELRGRMNELEEILIMIVRTGWPWDTDGEPNGMFDACRDGYVNAMVGARKLLGLDHLSMITRTEPRT